MIDQEQVLWPSWEGSLMASNFQTSSNERVKPSEKCGICNGSFRVLDERNKPWPCVCTFREHEVNNDPHIFHKDGRVSLRNPPKNWEDPSVARNKEVTVARNPPKNWKEPSEVTVVTQEIADLFRNVANPLSCTTTACSIGIGFKKEFAHWLTFLGITK